MQVPQGLTNPEKEVLCYYGDGAFSMTAYDTETVNRFKAAKSPSMAGNVARSATC